MDRPAIKRSLRDMRTVVVCGAGVVGCAATYFLSKLGQGAVRPILIERSRLAAAASGTATGFLAADWKHFFLEDRPVAWRQTAELHLRGFELHKRLASELNLQSYCTVPAWRAVATGVNAPQRQGAPLWLRNSALQLHQPSADTAYVDPQELCEKLLDAAVLEGAEFRIGRVDGIVDSGGGDQRAVTGVRVDGEIVPCDGVLIAMGPWSVLAQQWFSSLQLPLQARLGTAAIFADRGCDHVSATALFCPPDPMGRRLDVFTSVHGQMHCVGGIGDWESVSPEQLHDIIPEDVHVSDEDVKAMTSYLVGLSSSGKADLLRKRTVVRPCVADGLPVLGAVPGYGNTAHIAAGHDPWGILWGPVSGLAMAEHILHGKSSHVNLSALAPSRFQSRLQSV